jgi:hypothetical protein
MLASQHGGRFWTPSLMRSYTARHFTKCRFSLSRTANGNPNIGKAAYLFTTFFALGTSKTLAGNDFALYLICVKVEVRVSPEV